VTQIKGNYEFVDG